MSLNLKKIKNKEIEKQQQQQKPNKQNMQTIVILYLNSDILNIKNPRLSREKKNLRKRVKSQVKNKNIKIKISKFVLYALSKNLNDTRKTNYCLTIFLFFLSFLISYKFLFGIL